MSNEKARELLHDIAVLNRVIKPLAAMVGELEGDLRDAEQVPMPGAIIKHFVTGRLCRVVDENGELRLDTLTNAGIVRGVPVWTDYDIIQDGDPEEAKPF